MSLPDLVQTTLDFLDTQADGGNWDTNNAPHPTLIDGDEMRFHSDDSRARSPHPRDANLLTVDSTPTTQNEPIGTSFQYRTQAGVRVFLESMHADGGGQVADKDAFDTIVSEARRALMVDRVYPVGTFTHMIIQDENDRSPEVDPADYFRYEFDLRYIGFEDLP